MSYWKEFGRRLGSLGRRSRLHSELSDEMQFHIESLAEELEQAGAPRRQAMEQARREFG